MTAVLLSSRLSLIIADLIVILVTWRATYKVIKETGGLLKTSITQVLLFNGQSPYTVLSLVAALTRIISQRRSFLFHVQSFVIFPVYY